MHASTALNPKVQQAYSPWLRVRSCSGAHTPTPSGPHRPSQHPPPPPRLPGPISHDSPVVSRRHDVAATISQRGMKTLAAAWECGAASLAAAAKAADITEAHMILTNSWLGKKGAAVASARLDVTSAPVGPPVPSPYMGVKCMSSANPASQHATPLPVPSQARRISRPPTQPRMATALTRPGATAQSMGLAGPRAPPRPVAPGEHTAAHAADSNMTVSPPVATAHVRGRGRGIAAPTRRRWKEAIAPVTSRPVPVANMPQRPRHASPTNESPVCLLPMHSELGSATASARAPPPSRAVRGHASQRGRKSLSRGRGAPTAPLPIPIAANSSGKASQKASRTELGRSNHGTLEMRARSAGADVAWEETATQTTRAQNERGQSHRGGGARVTGSRGIPGRGGGRGRGHR
mmetsp:Transcript_3390/g.10413  ORF Transcript_3390/g.10413 Transcript_3390/m.10413 type:complete len:406 (-) Transcript_3390:1694-2911(-)